MRWRPFFRALHRDVGYAVAALTLAYSVSGIAVNHIEDWNPNYAFRERPVELGVLPPSDLQAMQRHVVAGLAIDPDTVRGHFLESPSDFRVFLHDGQEVRVDPRDGRGVYKEIRTRPGLYEANLLHLNRVKGAWTWIADLFALLLVFLSLTGLFMTKGAGGFAARGKWFAAAGLLLPLLVLWVASS